MQLAHVLPTACLAVGLATAAIAAGFDGTYAGTSAKFTGTSSNTGRGNSCTQFAAPSTLTISGGHAQVKWGDGTLQGDVGPDGKLTMRSNLSGLFQGQIDASGVLSGYYQGYCTYDLTWRRR